jgi:hypothetical protein
MVVQRLRRPTGHSQQAGQREAPDQTTNTHLSAHVSCAAGRILHLGRRATQRNEYTEIPHQLLAAFSIMSIHVSSIYRH